MARVFISYKRVDKAKVFKLKDKIQTAIGEDCWIDLDGIESDAIFKSVIIRAINESEIFLFMYSKAHSQIRDYENDWTIRELSFAKLKKKRIVFVNLDGSKLSDLFLFDYANKQQVDATSTEALNHLCTDLQKWLGSSTQSTKKQSSQAGTLSPTAMANLGIDYYYGRNGKQKDYVKAAELFRKAAERSNANAQCNLGLCYTRGRGVAKDYHEAVRWFQKAAEQGHISAQYNLGICYVNGHGVALDFNQAVKWYRKAAEQGHVEAQYKLGCSYENGDIVTKNKNKAIEWYRKAALQGKAEAQFRLGTCYENGFSGVNDYREAVNWYRKAAEQGNPEAKNSLGVCYQNGYGVGKDLAEAVKWYRQAAVQGNSYAQRNLGVCYEHGYGVAENQSEAIKWYRQAALQENSYAKARLKALGINF